MTKSALDTPMMRQYLAVKEQHPDSIVFYRMGDFYEMFLDDAVEVAPLLDITLTTRDKGKADAVPMRIVVPDVTRKPWALRLTDEFKSGACHAGQYEESEQNRDAFHDVLRGPFLPVANSSAEWRGRCTGSMIRV